MAKSSPDSTVRSFVMFRVTGDKLMPDEVTDVFGISPTLAYRKGYEYRLSNSSSPIVGKTGVWYFSTETIISSTKMSDHLIFFLSILGFPEMPSTQSTGKKSLIKLRRFQHLLQRRELKSSVTFFWHGLVGARPPAIPRVVSSILREIPIEIETDFEVEEGSRHIA